MLKKAVLSIVAGTLMFAAHVANSQQFSTEADTVRVSPTIPSYLPAPYNAPGGYFGD